jgi:hypothetical protein
MTPAEKMAARKDGTTTVTVHEASPPAEPAFDPLDPLARIRLKQAKHAEEQKAKAKATAAAPTAEAPPAAMAVVAPEPEVKKPDEAAELAALEEATRPGPRGNRR